MSLVRTLLLALCAPVVLLACSPAAPPEAQRRMSLVSDPLPAMKSFGQPQMPQTTRSNGDIARDFLELAFQMESGRAVPVLTRFDGPVTIKVQGQVPGNVAPDLARLIGRLKHEAGIDLSQVGAGQQANITVEFLSRAALQAIVPQAACFVVPNVTSWAAFKRARHGSMVEWGGLTKREQVAVFIPNDTSPQEMRDCLHEEVAQALGPLNDLYRLQDSVFNDDNFNTVLTGFDMLILRTYYAPQLANGMTKAQVTAALPGILSAIHPAGNIAAGRDPGPTARIWIDAVETALGPNDSIASRRENARRSVAIAKNLGWTDARMAFSLFALGRLALADESGTAQNAFEQAGAIYRSLPGAQVHAAHVDMQLAAFALSAGDAGQALALVNRSLAPVQAAENAALLATLLMIKSEALIQLGRVAEAQAVRLDSLGWARYGFGPEAEVRTRMSEIAALSPRQRTPEL